MSDEHIEPNQTQNNDGRRRRRRQRHKNRPRTMRWYHESNVGTEDLLPNVVVKFFISIAEDETPEIYFLPMNRDTITREDGSVGFKPVYAGDIERNAIPLSITDLDSVWNTLVSMKSKMLRMQDDFRGRPHEPPPLPKRSQQPVRSLTHRMEIPARVVAAAPTKAPEPRTPPPKTAVLADALPGW